MQRESCGTIMGPTTDNGGLVAPSSPTFFNRFFVEGAGGGGVGVGGSSI